MFDLVPRLAQAVSCGLENVADRVCGTITSEGSVDDPQTSNTITNIYLQVRSISLKGVAKTTQTHINTHMHTHCLIA